jgi:hypothetical protein
MSDFEGKAVVLIYPSERLSLANRRHGLRESLIRFWSFQVLGETPERQIAL